jgi:AcrR family transcriptional regulator
MPEGANTRAGSPPPRPALPHLGGEPSTCSGGELPSGVARHHKEPLTVARAIAQIKQTFVFFVDEPKPVAQAFDVVTRTRSRRPDAGRILDSARREFARRGYADTSLRQLMAAAKVSTTAFYSRFGSKEEVLRALVDRLLGEIDASARNELALAKGLDDGFRRGVKALVAVLGPQRELVRIVLTQAASPEVSAALGDRFAALAALLSAQIRALDSRKAVDADSVAWSLVGALHMQVLRWAVYGQLETNALVPALHAVAEAHLPALRNRSRRRCSKEQQQPF